MTNGYIPRSTWIIQREYFTAKPVKDFKVKYLHWLAEYEGGAIDLEGEVLNIFINYMENNNVVQLYQFPNTEVTDYHNFDYFEMVDDNHVIPRHLFELVVGD